MDGGTARGIREPDRDPRTHRGDRQGCCLAPRRILLRGTAGALLSVFPFLSACDRASPEQALRDTIAAMVQAVESRDAKALFDHVADDFTRDSGGLDRRQMRALLLGLLLRNRNIRIVTTVREVRIEGNRGRARLHLLATGGAGLLPERGRLWDVSSAWRREGGDWKLYNAEWTD